mmetsp:Transcript_37170/g.43238  ORF Transcript_37170/g.43238 Transcript_37170/m.43238 type:complete len:407 (-) Transcript_37170:54-1274(-)
MTIIMNRCRDCIALRLRCRILLVPHVKFMMSLLLVLLSMCRFSNVVATITVHPTLRIDQTIYFDSFPAEFGMSYNNQTWAATLVLPDDYDGLDPYLCLPRGNDRVRSLKNDNDVKNDDLFSLSSNDYQTDDDDSGDFTKTSLASNKHFTDLSLFRSLKQKQGYESVMHIIEEPHIVLPLALLVKRGECTFAEKARNAMTIKYPLYVHNTRILVQPFVKHLVIYNYADDKNDLMIMTDISSPCNDDADSICDEDENEKEEIPIGLLFTEYTTGELLKEMIVEVELRIKRDNFDMGNGIAVDDEHTHDDVVEEDPFSEYLSLSSLAGIAVDLDGDRPVENNPVAGIETKDTEAVVDQSIEKLEEALEKLKGSEEQVGKIRESSGSMSFEASFRTHVRWYMLALVIIIQ